RIFDGLQGFRAVDRHTALLIDHLPTVAPQEPMGVVVAVADAMAVSESGGMAALLKCAAEGKEVIGGFGEFGPARLLDPALAIDDGIANRGERQCNETIVSRRVCLRPVIPAAIFFAEILAKLGHIEQLV